MTLLKGALVSFAPTFLPLPVPDITVFQYNPESLTHTWSQQSPAQAEPERSAGRCGRPGTETGNPFAVPGMPGEQFSLTLVVDANEDVAEGGASGALAEVSGVYTRLAAIELLLYPAGSGRTSLLGQATAALGLGGAGATRTVPDSTVPVVLFVWGPLRIVPVRITALTITETLYDRALNPVHAEARLEMNVTTPTELQAAYPDGAVLAKVATVAYNYTLGVRQAAAAANLANAGQSIIGMLP
jgi:hypothetical protein